MKTFGTPAVIAAALGLAALVSLPASADVISVDIGTGNTAISGFTGPYQTLEIDLTSATTATLTFDSLINGGNIYLMGDGGTVGVNVNATAFTLDSVSGSNNIVGFTPGPYSQSLAGNEDGFGTFNLRITSFDGFTHSSTEVVLEITNDSGTWATAADVLTGNSLGNIAATHTFVCAEPCSVSSGAVATGFASTGESSGGNPSGFAPEPGTLALLGLGLAVIGFSYRRKLSPL